MKTTLIVFLFSSFLFSQQNWLKGNLHTHSLWSDGDDFPEMVISWYKNNGYDFVALSDHNTIAEGEKWVQINKRKIAFEQYLKKFGSSWVQQQQDSVRLKTFQEYKSLLEEPGKFLIIHAEEISDKFEKKPLHINATNIREQIDPQGGSSVLEVMQNNVDAINKQREKTGQPVMPHINHPNFVWAVTAEDLINLEGDKIFEIYNGHPLVNNFGDSIHPGTERMWDIILTERIISGKDIMYGVAVDDAHSYFDFDIKHSNPGRGWVMVNADSLSPESIIKSMEEGKFYASSGVEIDEINFDGSSLSIKIKTEPGAAYTTQFIGTKKDYDKSSEARYNSEGEKITRSYSKEVGKILKEEKGENPVYKISGDEIYLRATVVSSKKKVNPYQTGENEAAWIQPVLIQKNLNGTK